MSHARSGSSSRRRRRGFSLIEALVALAITASLMTAVMVALRASFQAYRATTQSASRHTVARMTMHRLLAMLRTGSQFGPYPANVITDPVLLSDYVEFATPDGQILRIEYRPDDEALWLILDPGGSPQSEILMSGIAPRFDADGVRIPPFTLEYAVGPRLHRATIDLTITGDPDIELSVEGNDVDPIRLVGSTMPRNNFGS